MAKKHEVQSATVDKLLKEIKVEIASELGIPNYDKINRGTLPSTVNGKIGGTLVRRIVRTFEKHMEDYPELVAEITHPDRSEDEVTKHAKQDMHDLYGTVIDKVESEITE